jgi:hypothetical protein
MRSRTCHHRTRASFSNVLMSVGSPSMNSSEMFCRVRTQTHVNVRNHTHHYRVVTPASTYAYL